MTKNPPTAVFPADKDFTARLASKHSRRARQQVRYNERDESLKRVASYFYHRVSWRAAASAIATDLAEMAAELAAMARSGGAFVSSLDRRRWELARIIQIAPGHLPSASQIRAILGGAGRTPLRNR